jgi:hypothetical protein
VGITVTVPATVKRLSTVARAKAEVGLTDTSQDVLLGLLLDEASDAIAAYTHRVWGRETVIETLPGSGRRLLGLSRTPLISISSLTEDGVAVTDYTIEDARVGALARDNGWWPALAGGWDAAAYSSGYILPGVQRWRYAITYQAGFILPEEATPTLPGGVERACLETVKDWYAARSGRDPALVAVSMGTERVQYAAPGATTEIGALPPVALSLLEPWRPGYGGI